MKIAINHRILADKSKSLYLDYYLNGKRIREFLKLYLLPGKTSDVTIKNKESMDKAKQIAHNRGIEMVANNYSQYDITPNHKKNVDFIVFYEKFLAGYTGKDIRIVKYSLVKFKDFISQKGHKTISGNEITESLCKEFKQYLESNLNGETPYNYFTKFKRVLKEAQEQKIINSNPADKIKNNKSGGLKKSILNIDEIAQLARTPHNNTNIRKAFLFCLNTGLRYCDVKEMKWNNIDSQSQKLVLTQAKTKHSSVMSQVNIDLNNNAIRLIADRGKPDEPVFKLPDSIQGSIKSLKVWCRNAGIEKNITWHSARHSFAVNLLRSDVAGADIKTVSSLLGHSSLKHTEKYLHVVNELKAQAVNRLPEFEV
jgi:integrase/recombinase XerD